MNLSGFLKEVDRISEKMTREELADFLCVNRSALSHELSKMAAEGLIAFHRNEFTLLEAGEALCTWRETD